MEVSRGLGADSYAKALASKGGREHLKN